MRRAKLVLAVAAVIVAMLVAFSGPAIAQNRHHHFFHNNGVFQDSDQDADSGDIDQSVDVSQTGDNSNQCVGISGVANTGNPQSQFSATQFDDFGDNPFFFDDFGFFTNDDFEFDDSGATLDVSGSPTTSCDQQVNQAAAAG